MGTSCSARMHRQDSKILCRGSGYTPNRIGGEGGIRTHVGRVCPQPISSRCRCDRFGTSPDSVYLRFRPPSSVLSAPGSSVKVQFVYSRGSVPARRAGPTAGKSLAGRDFLTEPAAAPASPLFVDSCGAVPSKARPDAGRAGMRIIARPRHGQPQSAQGVSDLSRTSTAHTTSGKP